MSDCCSNPDWKATSRPLARRREYVNQLNKLSLQNDRRIANPKRTTDRRSPQKLGKHGEKPCHSHASHHDPVPDFSRLNLNGPNDADPAGRGAFTIAYACGDQSAFG